MSTTVKIEIEFDDDVAARVGDSPRAINSAAREAIVPDLFRRAAISGGRASAMLEMDRLDFMRLASSRGLPVIDMTAEEWQEEVRRVRLM
jgi:predicted HTH domain antitoxin